ncbi:NepR family anti-sigma factor [Pseudahrensia aquimaris]|uniref:NepR family anti-sigma factor n=1 Tax=Pseudahrensia aquimaris TaxID=744461 RepID=A0ABW3FGU0_9HYPH
MTNDANDANSKPALKADIQAKIGEKLKEAYADVVNEPVPDRFLDLLNQLEASSPKTKPDDKGSNKK